MRGSCNGASISETSSGGGVSGGRPRAFGWAGKGESDARSRAVRPDGDSRVAGNRRKVGLMRTGSLRFRLRDRQGAMACAKDFGSTPSREVWHLEPVDGAAAE